MLFDFMFEVVGEDSDICGEQFFVECETKPEAWAIAHDNFPEEELHYCGRYTVEEAEWIGLDTY